MPLGALSRPFRRPDTRLRGRLGRRAAAPADLPGPSNRAEREDEAFYILEGEIRFRRGEDEFTAGPGAFVFGPREVAHCFKVLEGGARALVLVTPAGLEHMFVEGGVPLTAGPPSRDYDVQHTIELARKYGFDVVGPPLP